MRESLFQTRWTARVGIQCCPLTFTRCQGTPIPQRHGHSQRAHGHSLEGAHTGTSIQTSHTQTYLSHTHYTNHTCPRIKKTQSQSVYTHEDVSESPSEMSQWCRYSVSLYFNMTVLHSLRHFKCLQPSWDCHHLD